MEEKILPNEILNLIKIHQTQKENGDCPSCIRLYEVFEDEEFVHLVMEYCSAGSLNRIIQNKDEHSDDECKMQYDQNSFQSSNDSDYEVDL